MKSKSTFFTDSDSLRTIDTRRIIYLLICVFSFLITELGRTVYRPFIYSSGINDFGIADSIGNSGGILVQIFFGLTIFNSSRTKGLRLIVFFTVGYNFYEIVQPYLPRGVFDWKDVYATLIGGSVGISIFLLLHRLSKNNRIHYEIRKSS